MARLNLPPSTLVNLRLRCFHHSPSPISTMQASRALSRLDSDSEEPEGGPSSSIKIDRGDGKDSERKGVINRVNSKPFSTSIKRRVHMLTVAGACVSWINVLHH